MQPRKELNRKFTFEFLEFPVTVEVDAAKVQEAISDAIHQYDGEYESALRNLPGEDEKLVGSSVSLIKTEIVPDIAAKFRSEKE